MASPSLITVLPDCLKVCKKGINSVVIFRAGKATSFPGSSFTHPPERVGEEPEDGVAGKTY